MRHSSWTLFLVPLALPLVFLCIPGSMKSMDRSDPSAGESYERLQEEIPSSLEVTGLTLGSGENVSGETSEAFFKD